MLSVAEPGFLKGDKRSVALIAFLVFVVGFAIRLPGIGWGLPNTLHNQSYHPDEPLIFDFVHKSTIFHPETQREYYNYGTVFYAVMRVADSVGVIAGGKHPPASFDEKAVTSSPQAWNDLNSYFGQAVLWGRIAGALLGAATASIIFLILRRWISLLGALAGAAVIALSPAHVMHSRFMTVDVTALFFLSLATLACVRLLRPELQENKAWWRDVIIAAALAGVAASTRYSNALMFIPVAIALCIRRPQGWTAMLLATPFIAAFAFAITTPGVITDTSYFIDNFSYQASHANSGHGLVFVGRPSGFLFHIYQLMIGITAPATVVGLIGIVYAAIRKHHWAWLLLGFFIPYYLSIGSVQVMFLRYGFPLYIGVACGFGYAISAIQRRMNNQWAAAGLAALCLLGIENGQSGARGVALFTKWMTETDPRDEAGAYIADQCKQIPNLDIGVLGTSPWFWSAAVMKDADYAMYKTPEVQAQILAATRNPHVVSFTSGDTPLFATYSSYEVEDAIRLKDNLDLDIQSLSDAHIGNEQVRILNERYSTVATFGGGGPTIHDLEYIRPTIWVMKRKS